MKMKNTTHQTKRKLTRSPQRAPKEHEHASYTKPTTLQSALRQLHLASRDSDQWLVTVCQHITINCWTRQQVADHILATFDTGYHQPTEAEAYTIAGRLHRLSRDEDALIAIKYGLQPIAKRISIKLSAI